MQTDPYAAYTAAYCLGARVKLTACYWALMPHCTRSRNAQPDGECWGRPCRSKEAHGLASAAERITLDECRRMQEAASMWWRKCLCDIYIIYLCDQHTACLMGRLLVAGYRDVVALGEWDNVLDLALENEYVQVHWRLANA